MEKTRIKKSFWDKDLLIKSIYTRKSRRGATILSFYRIKVKSGSMKSQERLRVFQGFFKDGDRHPA